MRNSIIDNQKGVTLAEVLAVLIIASIVISAVTFVIQQTIKSYQTTTEQQLVQKDAVFVTDLIVKSVRERSKQSLTTDEASNCILKLEKSEHDYTCFIFDHNAHTLHMVKSTDDTTTLNQLISNKLQSLDINITGNKIDLSLQYIIMNNTTYTYETTVYIPYL